MRSLARPGSASSRWIDWDNQRYQDHGSRLYSALASQFRLPWKDPRSRPSSLPGRCREGLCFGARSQRRPQEHERFTVVLPALNLSTLLLSGTVDVERVH
ncbi:hypothetical protein BD309DRAFT_258613 [Dichomitus squalens]|nr:hypothetical protein BD309DRAFT_258613 [Dichomitus squalens]